MAIKQVLAASLVEDMDVYPRTRIDDSYVSRLAEAIRSGASLPPVVADAKSKVMVDGVQRRRAFIKVLGPKAKVTCELIPYKNRKELLQDAVARNTTHGRKLEAQDQVRSIHLLRGAGFEEEAIAQTLHITKGRVEKMMVHFVVVPKGAPRAISQNGKTIIPTKPSIRHLDGRTLNSKQARATYTTPGTNYRLLVRQLREGIEHGFVSIDDKGMAAALRGLADAIYSAVGE